MELIETLRYKLCMFGIPIKGAANMYCDNNSVVTNTSYPESKLNKKHNAIAYHKVREAVAAGTVWVGKEDSKTNIADMLIKVLPGPRLNDLCSRVLFWHNRYNTVTVITTDYGIAGTDLMLSWASIISYELYEYTYNHWPAIMERYHFLCPVIRVLLIARMASP